MNKLENDEEKKEDDGDEWEEKRRRSMSWCSDATILQFSASRRSWHGMSTPRVDGRTNRRTDATITTIMSSDRACNSQSGFRPYTPPLDGAQPGSVFNPHVGQIGD